MNQVSLVMVLVVALFVRCESSSQIAGEKLYLLEAVAGMQWCIYRNEAEWSSDVERQQAMAVATVEYVDGRLSAGRILSRER